MSTRIQQLDGVIQRGRGVAAKVLGQTYDVYRLGAGTNAAIISGSPVIATFPARIEKASKKAIENASFDLLVAEATCDNRTLKLQDVLVETGYKNDGGVWTLAQMRPTRETLWVRTDANVSITRPKPTAGAATQQPASGFRWNKTTDGYSGVWKAGDQVLTLTNGMYSFQATGATPASIQCGLQPNARVRDGNTLSVPTEMYRDQFYCYIPDLPGEQLDELDRLAFQNGDRYELVKLYSSDGTGLTGHICILEKLGN